MFSPICIGEILFPWKGDHDMRYLMLPSSFFLCLVFLLVAFQSFAQVVPTRVHPRIWLTDARMTELRAARDANTPEWQELNDWLTSNYSQTSNYDLKTPSAEQPGQRSINWDGETFNGYRGLSWLGIIINYALGYQMLKDVDPVRAEQYGELAVAIVNGMIRVHSVGEEDDNGILMMRAGDGIYNLTNNQAEVAAAQAYEYSGLVPTYRAGKYGYAARAGGFALPVAYDWLYELLTPEETDRWRRVMFRWFDWCRGVTSEYNNGILYNGVRYHEQNDGPCDGVTNVCTDVSAGYQVAASFWDIGDNFWSGVFSMMMLTGVATYGDVPDAVTYYNYARTDMWENQLKAYWESPQWGKGGDAVEGWNYGGGTFRNLYALAGLDSATGGGLFDNVPYPDEYIQSYIHATASNLTDMYNHGQWSGTNNGRPYQYHLFPAQYVSMLRGGSYAPYAQWYLDNANFALDGSTWERFLFKKTHPSPLSVESLPLVYHNEGSDLFALRSSWANAPDSVNAWFQLGQGTRSTHENYDEGAFQIIRGNDKLIWDSGLQRDAWRQSIIQFGSTASQMPYGNDWVVKDPILAQEHTAEYSYIRADLRGGYQKNYYPSRRADLYLKDVLYLRPNLFVIYDVTHTDASLAAKWKNWQTQYPGPPVTDAQNQLITFTNGASKIFVKTLYPVGVTMTTATESGIYRYVKTRPNVEQEYDQFLHVVEVTGKNRTAMAKTVRIDAESGNMRGVFISDPSSPEGGWVALFTADKEGTLVSGDVSYVVTANPGYPPHGHPPKHIIMDLVPNSEYTFISPVDKNVVQSFILRHGSYPLQGEVYRSSENGVIAIVPLKKPVLLDK